MERCSKKQVVLALEWLTTRSDRCPWTVRRDLALQQSPNDHKNDHKRGSHVDVVLLVVAEELETWKRCCSLFLGQILSGKPGRFRRNSSQSMYVYLWLSRQWHQGSGRLRL